MDSKLYLVATICIIGGLVGGYFLASTTLQNQLVANEVRLQNKDSEISTLTSQVEAQTTTINTLTTMVHDQEAEIQALESSITIYEAQITQQSTQAQTQIRVDGVLYTSRTQLQVSVRNTGSVNAVTESIWVRRNSAGSTWDTIQSSTQIQPGQAVTIPATLNVALIPSSSYVIRVTTTTGFYYEYISNTPSTI